MGSEESKPNPEQQKADAAALKKQKAEESRVAKQLQGEKLSNALEENINKYDEKIRKDEAKLEKMKERAKELM